MLSKNKTKFIQSLKLKKFRDSSHLFVAEGLKTIIELWKGGYTFETIICTPETTELIPNADCEVIIATSEEIKKTSFLNTPQPALALVFQRIPQPIVPELTNDLVIALDEIQDPGNLGTIIRLCSWFGVKNLVCSENTADCYNPKVVQATMGALSHVNINYTALKPFIQEANHKLVPTYGTFLSGESIYKETLLQNGIIVLGNEGNGISPPIERLITKKLFIPPYGKLEGTVESLNVSMAASIICSEFRRRSYV